MNEQNFKADALNASLPTKKKMPSAMPTTEPNICPNVSA